MIKYIEPLSMLFDNFILYIFYQTMFEKKRESIPKYAVVVPFILSDLIYWFFASNVIGESTFGASMMRSALTVLLNAAISMFFRSTIVYRMLVVFSYIALINISENLAYYIIVHFTGLSAGLDDLPYKAFIAISLVSNLIILFFTMILNLCRKLKSGIRSRTYTLLLLVVPAMSCVLTFLPSFFKMNFIEPEAYLTLVVFLLIMNITNYVLLQNVLKAEALSQESKVLQQQMQFQKNKYQQLSDAYKNIRGFMHDTKKHLFYIEQCVNEERYDRIIPYTRETMLDLESRYCSINTGNLVIDSFVSNVILQASSNGIHINTRLRVEKDLIPCDDYHMTIILGNLLDNAMNACTGQTGGTINLDIQTVDNSFVIHITNTYHAPPDEKLPDNFDNFDFIHGYGLKNVKRSAEECGGFCLIDYEDGLYSITVIVPLKKASYTE